MSKDAAKLQCLDGLRGLAVLAVILLHHRLAIEAAPAHSAFYRLLAPTRFGLVGVHLFLVLSGFCLTHSLIRRSRAGRAPSLRSYLAARWWRIAPPYYAAILLYIGVTALYARLGHAIPETRVVSLRQVVVHVLFLHGLRPDTLEAINAPFWSLSLEFQFYATLPLLFALACRRGYGRVVGGVAAASLAWRIGVMGYSRGAPFLTNGIFLGRWTEFALGMAVAGWYHGEGRAAIGRPTGLALSAAAVVLIPAGLALTVLRPTIVGDFVLGGGFAALLAAALVSAERGGRLGRAVAFPPLVAVGAISYSLYLTHSLAIEWAVNTFGPLLPAASSFSDVVLLVTALAAVGALGAGFYALVERRFVRSVDAGQTESAAPTATPSRRPHVLGFRPQPRTN